MRVAPVTAEVSKSARANCGHAGLAFLERLVAERDTAFETAKRQITAFRSAALQPTDPAQISRICFRFAVTAAAGELAASWGIVPWKRGEAEAAARFWFERVADAWGRQRRIEDSEAFRHLRAWLQQNEHSAFRKIVCDPGTDEPTPGDRIGEQRSLTQMGWIEDHLTEGRLFLIPPESFEVIMKGFRAREVAKALAKEGFLYTRSTDPGNQWRRRAPNDPGGQVRNFYAIRISFLSEPAGDSPDKDFGGRGADDPDAFDDPFA